jgi:hypothetical protein
MVKPGGPISEMHLHERIWVRASGWNLLLESGEATLDLGAIDGILIITRDPSS